MVRPREGIHEVTNPFPRDYKATKLPVRPTWRAMLKYLAASGDDPVRRNEYQFVVSRLVETCIEKRLAQLRRERRKP